MKDVLTEVVEDLQPSNDDKRETVLNTLREHIDDATIQLGGSVSKNTHVGDDYDIDIFIKYPLTDDDDISDALEKQLQRIGWTYKRIQASRDYFVISEGSHDYELVPVRDITKPAEAETVIDISPLHIDYFNEQATSELRDQVRLLKQFMKSEYIYGAESYINGFSGHVVDLLTIAYGSFHDVLTASQEWSPKTIIDIEEHHDTPMLTLNESKTSGPLIVVDPIQSDRNAAAAVDISSYNRFISAAERFTTTPSAGQFDKPDLEDRITLFEERMSDSCVTVHIEVGFDDDQRHDLSGAQLVKIKEHCVRHLDKESFHVFDSFIHHERTSDIIIGCTPEPTSDQKVLAGPPLDKETHVQRFRDAHSQTETRQGRVFAHEPHTYDDLLTALNAVLDDDYVQERCQRTTVRRPSS